MGLVLVSSTWRGHGCGSCCHCCQCGSCRHLHWCGVAGVIIVMDVMWGCCHPWPSLALHEHSRGWGKDDSPGLLLPGGQWWWWSTMAAVAVTIYVDVVWWGLSSSWTWQGLSSSVSIHKVGEKGNSPGLSLPHRQWWWWSMTVAVAVWWWWWEERSVAMVATHLATTNGWVMWLNCQKFL